ncbi:MAG: hypothetical protein Q8933_06495 [Bacteroidota bacterium]|nr:hypothetical protein [Bacteroidota bacterium]MDP4190927.1 hypothetical protein [Bacteroidota bacterium]
MLEMLSSFIKKLSNKVGFTIFLVIYCVSFYLYFFSDYPFSIKNILPYSTVNNVSGSHFFYSPETAYEAFNKTGIPDLQFFNSGADIYNTLLNFGFDGRRAYEHILLADIIYPVIYGIFYSILLTLILKKAFPSNSFIWGFNILPLVATFFDYVENAAIIQMIIAFPGKLRNIGSIPGIFTFLKHLFLVASELAIVTGLIMIVFNKIKSKSPAEA